MTKGLIFLLLVVLSSSQINPTWSQSPRFDAGDVIMVNNHLSTTWTTNFTVTYHLGKQLTTPWVGLSIRQLRIASNSGQIKFRTNLLNFPTTTNFVVNVDVLTPTEIWFLKVRYLAFDGGFSQFSTFNLQYNKYTTGAGGSNINTIDRGLGTVRTETFSSGITVATPANRQIMVAFTAGFIGTFNTTNFQGNVTEKLDGNTVKLDVTVSAQTLITQISFYVFVADADSLLASCWIFVQTSVTKSVRGVQTTFYNPARAPFDYNYISGLRSFSLQHNMQYNFTISGLVFYTYTNSYHNDVRHLNLWGRFCPSPYIVFNKVDFLCYAACPAGTYLVVNDTLCLACHYTCATCSSSAACDTCPAFRTLNNNGTGLCDCIDYYYQLNQVCVPCHYSCKKCTYSGQYFNCMACDSNMFRTPASPNNSTCNCSNGYVDVGVTMCKQICGDGKVYTQACDDGNLNQGDGCSSVCSVQSNFQCVNPTPANTPASSCYYIGDMVIDVVRIQKHPNANMATFYLNITPYSPILSRLTSQNMITNLTGATFVSVFQFGQLIAYNVTYNQSFEGKTIMFGLKPSASGPLSRFFPKNDTFAAYCSNGLLLNYYSTTHYLQAAVFGNACYILGFLFSAIGAILCFGDWKQLGLEMMFSLQICFMIFLAFTFYNPYITNVLSFRNVMGWNGQVVGRQILPYHSVPILEHMGYSVAFQNNFNIMAIFPGTALLLYALYRGFMYRHQKRRLSGETSKDFEQTLAGKILSYFNFELFVYWMLFSMQQILMSTVIQSQYIKNGAIYIFIVLCLVGIIISAIALFIRPKSMKSFREKLFHTTYGNKTFLGVFVSVIFMDLILLLAVLVSRYIFYAMFFPPLVIGIYVIARRPFKLMWNNIRLFIIQLCLIVSITLVVVMINISYEESHLLVLGVMSCMVLIALVTIISWIYDIVKKICRLRREEDYEESSKKGSIKQEQSINEKVREAGFALVHGNTKGSLPTVYHMAENPTPKNRNQLSKFKSPRQPVSSKRNFDDQAPKKYDNSKIRNTEKPKPAEDVTRSKSKEKSNPNLTSQRPNNNLQELKNNREDTLQRIEPTPRKKRANPYQQILDETANRYKN